MKNYVLVALFTVTLVFGSVCAIAVEEYNVQFQFQNFISVGNEDQVAYDSGLDFAFTVRKKKDAGCIWLELFDLQILVPDQTPRAKSVNLANEYKQVSDRFSRAVPFLLVVSDDGAVQVDPNGINVQAVDIPMAMNKLENIVSTNQSVVAEFIAATLLVRVPILRQIEDRSKVIGTKVSTLRRDSLLGQVKSSADRPNEYICTFYDDSKTVFRSSSYAELAGSGFLTWHSVLTVDGKSGEINNIEEWVLSVVPGRRKRNYIQKETLTAERITDGVGSKN